MNTATVSGEVVDARHREYPSGDVWEFEVLTIDDSDGISRSERVPVQWVNPVWRPSTGDEVRVEGSIGRRYFRVAGATQSRVYVGARSVVRLPRPTRFTD
jgi:hypothetical protein